MEAEQLFSKEEIQNISDLGNVLREIRSRLKREGVSIEEARKKLRATRRRTYASKQRQNQSA